MGAETSGTSGGLRRGVRVSRASCGRAIHQRLQQLQPEQQHCRQQRRHHLRQQQQVGHFRRVGDKRQRTKRHRRPGRDGIRPTGLLQYFQSV